MCKNERENFPRFLESVKDCFHEIHVTDTGSTDGTVELLKDYESENPAGTTLFNHRFNWVNDFSAARNYSFSHSRADYLMWMDLDDVMLNPQAFIEWRDTLMATADFWVATYHYGGIDDKGNSPCKFIRERVVRNNGNFQWKFFVHEGLVPKSPMQANYAVSWSINHKRTNEDQAKDRSRNLLLFEGRTQELCPRMRYYYGKELFENGQPLQAYSQLLEAAKHKDLEPHDRIMALQFACAAAMQCQQFDSAIDIAHQGLKLDPARGEFHIFIADSLVKQQKLKEAIPFFMAAKSCNKSLAPDRADVIFNHADAYGHYPRNQLARCYFHTNQPKEAKKILEEALEYGPNIETTQLFQEVNRIQGDLQIKPISELSKTRDIVFTCIPNVIKDWDERTLATKGLGGSETAVVHMAQHLHELTGRQVRVFNDRQTNWETDGVIYAPIAEMYAYFKEFSPAIHVAWRHNVRLTTAPTYLWCHDLGFLGVEQGAFYDGILALSSFHQNWLTHIYGVPKEKVLLTRNGLDPAKFIEPENREKDPYKLIFSSSPDRGLPQAIAVMDEVVKVVPEAKLHVFYGTANMRAMGNNQAADQFEAMVASRPFIVNHGGVPQSELIKEFESAALWLYPTTFLETFCITAIEALCAGVYPVVRKYGALPDTLKMAESAGMAELLDTEKTDEFAERVILALQTQAWQRVRVSPEVHAWREVAKEWLTLLPPLAEP